MRFDGLQGSETSQASSGPTELAISPASEELGAPFSSDYGLNCEAGHGLVGGYRQTTVNSIPDIAEVRQSLPSSSCLSNLVGQEAQN